MEGLTKAKTDVLVHLAQTHKVAVILLQATHVKESSHLKNPGYTLAAFTKSDVHGTATFVNNRNTWRMMTTCPEGSTVEWTAIDVEGIAIANVYKPPRTSGPKGQSLVSNVHVSMQETFTVIVQHGGTDQPTRRGYH